MNCDELKAVVYDYLDGELPAEKMSGADAHVASCASCENKISFEKSYRLLLRKSLTAQEAPSALKAKVRVRLAAEERHFFPEFLPRIFARPSLSFALALCLSILVVLPIFQSHKQPGALPHIIRIMNLPKKEAAHFLECKDCQDKIINMVLHHEEEEDPSHVHLVSFDDALRHLEKCEPCRRRAVEMIRAHIRMQT